MDQVLGPAESEAQVVVVVLAVRVATDPPPLVVTVELEQIIQLGQQPHHRA